MVNWIKKGIIFMKFMLPSSRKGFTLIELLIVIALLGALAVGLIGAIDPFEQLKKGTDTGVRDLVSQVQTAVIRYYSVKNNFPSWAVQSGTAYKMADVDASGTVTINATLDPGITEIVNAGELTSNFTQTHGGQLANVYLTQRNADAATGTSATITVCYQPQSKSFQSDPNTKFDKDGSPWAGQTTCKSAGGTAACYWCIQ